MLRFSLRTLGVGIALIAVACAALLKANPWVASTAWTLVFVVLSMATIAAVLSPPNRRGFWTGFAIVGWLYLIVGIGPLSGVHNGKLLTTAAIHRAAALLPQQDAQGPAAVASALSNSFSSLIGFTDQGIVAGTPLLYSYPPPQPSVTEPAHSFISIGQSLWTLFLALIGGWFGAFIVSRRSSSVRVEPTTSLGDR
jgi:cbb3-type cytochrome oxidase subunit 3